MFWLWTFILTSLVIPSVLAADHPWQTQFHAVGEDWHKYVRAPPREIVRPARVLGSYTYGDVINPDGLITGTASTILTRIPKDATAAGASDVTPSIVVDWGQNMAGIVSIEFGGSLNTTTGRPGIRLAFSETLQFLSNVSDFSRSDNGETIDDHITPGSDQIAVRPAPYTWTNTHGCEFGDRVCADGLHGFRYMKISLDALPADAPYTSSYGQVSITSVSLDFSGFRGTPETFTGWFESSDEQLNQWWYDGVYTNDMCTDTFRANDTDPRQAGSSTLIGKLVLHDGAKRDRDPYVGDLAVASRTSYLSHDTAAATRNVLADIADHQRADGWLPPASIRNYTLPLYDYPLWWVVCSYDLFMYTGDTAYVTKYYPHLRRVLDTFYPSTTNLTTGLLSKGIGVSEGYGDYAFLPRSGTITYYNALYVLALDHAASIALSLGHEADYARWFSRARTVSKAMDQLFDASSGAFYDGGICNGTFCPTHAQDGNSLSILAGATNTTRARSILGHLSSQHARPYGNAFYDNDVLGPFSQRVYAFISYFEIAARFRTGLAVSALEEIRRLYGWMSTHDPGVTTWEGIGPGGVPFEDGFTSLAHGWATGIVPALTNYVLGVEPTGPGFSSWAVRPVPGDVRWAKGVVPTPRGPIEVSWNGSANGLFSLRVTAPVGTRGVVSVPRGAGRRLYVNSQLVVQAASDDGYVNVAVDGGETHTVLQLDSALDITMIDRSNA